jgi:hypothetical protein
MALVADLGLVLGEQVLWRFRIMNRMTGGTGYIVLGMFRAPDVRPVKLFGVARQAHGDNFRWFHFAESMDDGIDIAARVHVFLARTMAGFTAGPFRRLLARSNRFEMGIFIEVVPDLVMLVTIPAPFLTCKFRFARCRAGTGRFKRLGRGGRRVLRCQRQDTGCSEQAQLDNQTA